MQPLVSLVITTYNREYFLGEAIASISQQTYSNFELLVWDDGSTDDSVALAQHYAAQDSRIRVVAADHAGRVEALKQAIAQTQGTYLGWVDSDDCLAPTALSATVSYLQAHPTVGLVYTDYYDTDAQGRVLQYGHRCQIPYSPQRLLVDFMAFHFRLLRRSLYEQVGGLDGSLNFVEDYDLCLRLSEITSFGRIRQPLYYYRQHPHNASQRDRLAQALKTHTILKRALQRRGMAQTHSIDLELPTQRFFLRQRPRHRPLAKFAPFLAGMPLMGLACSVESAIAQSIAPAADGTGTVVTPTGNQVNIGGGALSSDGKNLFHSFTQFGLSQGQIANFLANPQLNNILGRVIGNTPSVIDGRIQVSGGSPNLFLLNPAGIVFGPNASLNVPAAFTATTANAVGFGCGASGVGCAGWFKAEGNPDYSTLNGAPTGLAFTTAQPGSIVNAGNLTVSQGRSLALIGGTVINTGQLTAPEGEVVLAAVPGERFVRLSQPGSLLNLEFQPLAATANLMPPSAAAPTLPQLLTGGNLSSATGLTVNADGSVTLTRAGMTVPTTAGTAIASGSINTAGAIGGTVAVLGDRVGLVDATINATGRNGGGSVYIGGDYQGKGSLPTASQTFFSPGSTIDASATQSGNGGFVIVWANQAADFWGTIQARGGPASGNGGFVEVSGKETLKFRGTVNTSAPNGTQGTLLLDPFNIIIVSGASGTGANDGEITPPDGTIFAADGGTTSFTISEGALEALAGGTNVTLQATNDIIIQDLADNALTFQPGAGTIAFEAGGAIAMQDLNDAIIARTRAISLTANTLALGTIDTSATGGPFIPGNGGNITLNATSTIAAGDLLANGFGYGGSTAGAITVTSQTGAIAVGNIKSTVAPGFGGDVVSGNTVTLQTLSNGGNISFASIDTRGGGGFSPEPVNGGNVTINARGQVRGYGEISTQPGITIATSGSSGGSNGTVTIQHDGGPTNQSFTVANGAIAVGSGNGLLGAINTGTETLSGTTIGFTPSPFTSAGSSIQITYLNAPPTLNPIPALPNTPPNVPITTTVAALGLVTDDPNADNPLFVRVVSVAPGAILKINGVVAGPGTLVPADATLEYTPPPGFVGLLADAFSLAVDDVLSTSAPRAIAVNITEQPNLPHNNGNNDDPADLPNPCVLATCQTLPPQFSNPVTPSFELDIDTPEQRFTTSFESYLGIPPTEPRTLDEQRDIAQDIERETGKKPAFVYISFVPDSIPKTTSGIALVNGAESHQPYEGQATDQLEIVVVTAKGPVIRRRLPEATRDKVMALAQDFRIEVSDPRKTRTTRYLTMAQQLYRWMVAPIQAELAMRKIDNLVFLMDEGLRSLPVAAFHDGNQFLIEQYSVGLMPSLSLTDTRYQDIRDAQLLTLGISESTQGQQPLPSVTTEVSTLVNQLWSGQSYVNQAATLQTLQTARQTRPYGIIHLATHANFLPGSLENSYIQLWENKLRLDQIPKLGWNKPQVQLLVLSACATALGDREAELGFGGIAIQAGVKSVVASLWSVNDTATAALITRFYKALKTAPIKAEALREAQLALLKQQVYIQNNQIIGVETTDIPLPADAPPLRDERLSHPFYWSSFTLIGNPW